jgi:hypothetical protein
VLRADIRYKELGRRCTGGLDGIPATESAPHSLGALLCIEAGALVWQVTLCPEEDIADDAVQGY